MTTTDQSDITFEGLDTLITDELRAAAAAQLTDLTNTVLAAVPGLQRQAMTVPEGAAAVESLGDEEAGVGRAIALLDAIHPPQGQPADPAWWSTPLGVVCSAALARCSDEQAAALAPVTISHMAGVLDVVQGTVHSIVARNCIPRPVGDPGSRSFDARGAHREGVRLRIQRAQGHDRRRTKKP